MSSVDYPGAGRFYGASDNYTDANRPYSHPIDYGIVIHVTEGSWSSAINWFRDPNSDVSAHYTVRSSDGFIGQSVHEEDIAWHAGNWTYNQRTVAIEHEGYVDNPSYFTDTMYHSSAKLSAYLCNKYSIPVDRYYIYGHNEVPGATHSDPGPYWDWPYYMGLVRDYANNTSYKRVVDNADGRFRASSNWGKSAYSPQRYGDNYRFAKPAAVSDSAKFRFDIPADGTYEVYAWWPASSGYNASTPIGVKTPSGYQWVRVDQTQNGGKWNRIGTFEMAAGDDYKVAVSRWTSSSGYTIADAVKVVKA
jgi:N-acetyl-anhydromuramyl-L-alanine amidase AmpD